jgi:hypothetical protein
MLIIIETDAGASSATSDAAAAASMSGGAPSEELVRAVGTVEVGLGAAGDSAAGIGGAGALDGGVPPDWLVAALEEAHLPQETLPAPDASDFATDGGAAPDNS